MKLLELFAGSRSVGKEAEKLGFEVFSTDINDFEKIDLVKNIMDLKKEDIPFVPDVIWASPPCTYFSVASIGKHWNKDHTPKSPQALIGMAILEKTLEVISWFPNAIYFIENPRGKMRRKLQLPRTTVWYCQYGDHRAKPTDIWTNNLYSIENSNGWQPRKECFNGNKKCHHEAAPRGSTTGTQGLKGNYERSKIPSELCVEILKSI